MGVDGVAAEEQLGSHLHVGQAEGHETQLVPGRAVKLDLSRFPSRPMIQYWATGADTDVVGAAVKVTVDGQPVVERPLASAHGAMVCSTS